AVLSQLVGAGGKRAVTDAGHDDVASAMRCNDALCKIQLTCNCNCTPASVTKTKSYVRIFACLQELYARLQQSQH
ncbi:unnamed protein product, partial [Ceratitis capitata]